MQKQQEIKYNDNWEKIQACNVPSGTFPLSLPRLLNGIQVGTSAIERIGSEIGRASCRERVYVLV